MCINNWDVYLFEDDPNDHDESKMNVYRLEDGLNETKDKEEIKSGKYKRLLWSWRL